MMTQVEKFVENQDFAPSQFQQYLGGENLNTPPLKQPVENTLPNRERIKHILIGSPKAVRSTIHYLQIIGYASVGDWSPLLPTENSGEVMSILIRQILIP
ncbi:hypothetical protein [Fortiea contorta]|uniref:hypothetical protein n=1 Tax=Fortiea contorta TaxID=1892405 RepID=UPI000362B286|nr:hypothetical protein [Fortiea contorta]